MIDPKPLVAALASAARHLIRICLVLGVVMLASGCLAGFETPDDRVLFLALLGG